jgi:hypothetical protein
MSTALEGFSVSNESELSHIDMKLLYGLFTAHPHKIAERYPLLSLGAGSSSATKKCSVNHLAGGFNLKL